MPAITPITVSECSGVQFTVTPVNNPNGVVPTGTTYSSLTPILPFSLSGGAAGSNALNINGTLNNGTSIPQTAVDTVTPAANGCTGLPFTVTITVNPVSVITNIFDTICSGNTFTVTPANGPNGTVLTGTTYNWPCPTGPGITGGTASVGNPDSISGTLTNTTTIIRIATYIVTPKTNGCSGLPFTVKVIVKPAYYSIVNHPNICQGGSVVVGTHVYTTSGAYTDYMTTALGCDSTITTILVVNDTFNIRRRSSICQGDTVKVGTYNYTTAGTYIDHLTTLIGCDSTVTTVLTVNQNPAIIICKSGYDMYR